MKRIVFVIAALFVCAAAFSGCAAIFPGGIGGIKDSESMLAALHTATEENAYFFDFRQNVEGGIFIDNKTDASIPVHLYGYFAERDLWYLVGAGTINTTNFVKIGSTDIDGHLYLGTNLYSKYTLVFDNPEDMCAYKVYARYNDMIIELYNDIVLPGIWEYKSGSDSVVLTLFSDNTYTFEENGVLSAVGYFKSPLSSGWIWDRVSDAMTLYEVFSADGQRLKQNYKPLESSGKAQLKRKTLLLSDVGAYSHEYTFSNRNYNADSAKKGASVAAAETYRAQALQEFQKQYIKIGSTYYKRSVIPNITRTELLNFSHKSFVRNNPYGFDEQTLYIGQYGNIVQWLSNDAVLFDFCSVQSYGHTSLGLPYNGLCRIDGASDRTFADSNFHYLLYEGVYTYSTVRGSMNKVPQFRYVNLDK